MYRGNILEFNTSLTCWFEILEMFKIISLCLVVFDRALKKAYL